MRSVALLAALMIVAAWAMFRHLPNTSANAEAAVNRPVARLQEVRSIALDGRHLPQARLRDVLETRPGEQLDSARLERDRGAMERALADLGYLAARVDPAVITFDAAGAAYVTFEIDQGKLFHLRSVEITGPGKDAAIVTLVPGDDAIRARIERARQALADGLARRGKPTAVELSVHTDLAAAAVDVTLATR
ncbi:MAG TPA: POTRA domain-containing protein [Kofleriaceae bacterium]|nr:POTRA domain-containing protein [Kofleriaceae bacterium]